jgi:predicted ABC-type ATPase
MQPVMIVVAGPPGSGKSSVFPVSSFGHKYFNADDRAAELNGGSYLKISRTIRETVNRQFEIFVRDCIDNRESFAIETTLRSKITFDQASRAKAAGFTTQMRYLVLRDFTLHLTRVKARAHAGGHSASETTLRRIYEASLANLPRAISEMDQLWVYDNSPVGSPFKQMLHSENGSIRFLADNLPSWLAALLETS